MNILKITNPFELFGQVKDPKRLYRELIREHHPDHGGDNDQFVHLKSLWEKFNAADEADMGEYWELNGLMVESYAFAKGERANFYRVHNPDKPTQPLCLRIPRSGTDSSNAKTIIKAFETVTEVDENFRAFFPTPLRVIDIKMPKNITRRAVLMQRMKGWVTLGSLCDSGNAELHILDSAWIFRRMLAVTGAFYEQGVSHGQMELDHVFIEPALHGLAVCGTSQAKFKKTDLTADVAGVSYIMQNITDIATVPHHMQAFIMNLDAPAIPHPWELRKQFDEMLMEATGDRLRFKEFPFEPETID